MFENSLVINNSNLCNLSSNYVQIRIFIFSTGGKIQMVRYLCIHNYESV